MPNPNSYHNLNPHPHTEFSRKKKQTFYAVLIELDKELCHEEKHMNTGAQPQYFYFIFFLHICDVKDKRASIT